MKKIKNFKDILIKMYIYVFSVKNKKSCEIKLVLSYEHLKDRINFK